MVEGQQLRWFRTTLLGRTPVVTARGSGGTMAAVWLKHGAVSLTDAPALGVHADNGWLEIECKVGAIGDAPIARVDLSVSTRCRPIRLSCVAACRRDARGRHYTAGWRSPKSRCGGLTRMANQNCTPRGCQVRLHGSSETVFADLGRVAFEP